MDLATLIKEQKTVLLDGAMGTELEKAGKEMGGRSNISDPDAVLAIHTRYAGAGVDILIANTFSMNRINIEQHNIEVDLRQVNAAGVSLARAVAHEKQCVLGDIGSIGKLLKPHGPIPEENAYAAFKEQAAILAECRVDGFIVETMFDLREALLALRACREAADLPVIVSMSFSTDKRGGRTVMGNSALDCARALSEAGAFAVGANCGDIDPVQMSRLISIMREVTEVPIVAQPNAGRPKVVDNRTVFDMSPSQFAEGVELCLRAGAQIIGGCCGTTPSHIAALVPLVRSHSE